MHNRVRSDVLLRIELLDHSLVLGVQLHRQRAPARKVVPELDKVLGHSYFSHDLLRVYGCDLSRNGALNYKNVRTCLVTRA